MTTLPLSLMTTSPLFLNKDDPDSWYMGTHSANCSIYAHFHKRYMCDFWISLGKRERYRTGKPTIDATKQMDLLLTMIAEFHALCTSGTHALTLKYDSDLDNDMLERLIQGLSGFSEITIVIQGTQPNRQFRDATELININAGQLKRLNLMRCDGCSRVVFTEFEEEFVDPLSGNMVLEELNFSNMDMGPHTRALERIARETLVREIGGLGYQDASGRATPLQVLLYKPLETREIPMRSSAKSAMKR